MAWAHQSKQYFFIYGSHAAPILVPRNRAAKSSHANMPPTTPNTPCHFTIMRFNTRFPASHRLHPHHLSSWSCTPPPSSPSWCSVTLLNSSKGSASSPAGVASPLSNGTPVAAPRPFGVPSNPLPLPISKLPMLSFTLRKFTVSMARPWWGIIGGFMCRRRAHCVDRKNGWVLTSEAPAREPMRRSSSLMRSFRIRDLQRLQRHIESDFGKGTKLWRVGKRTSISVGHQNVRGRVRRRGECWRT